MIRAQTSIASGEIHGDDVSLESISQRFSADDAARAYLEGLRWPDGPACPHCANIAAKRAYKVTPNEPKRIRKGLFKCAVCEKTFTVTVGTVMEDTHLPLSTWLIGFFMMCASECRVSTLQVQKQLGIGSYRTAAYLVKRMRSALDHALPRHSPSTTIQKEATAADRSRADAPSSALNEGRGRIGYRIGRAAGMTAAPMGRERVLVGRRRKLAGSPRGSMS